jgi:hypothetical protein
MEFSSNSKGFSRQRSAVDPARTGTWGPQKPPNPRPSLTDRFNSDPTAESKLGSDSQPPVFELPFRCSDQEGSSHGSQQLLRPGGTGKFSSWVTKKSTTERVQDWRTGQTRRRVVDCWDVQGRADGVLWAKRFRAPAWPGLGRNGWTPATPPVCHLIYGPSSSSTPCATAQLNRSADHGPLRRGTRFDPNQRCPRCRFDGLQRPLSLDLRTGPATIKPLQMCRYARRPSSLRSDYRSHVLARP